MGGKKDLNFELNVIPMIDILSVCICFLLMTVVWVQVGSLKASQSMGGAAEVAKPPTPTVWITSKDNGTFQVLVKDVPKKWAYAKDLTLKDEGKSFALFLSQVKAAVPDLHTGIILPAQKTAYSDIILIMDNMKRAGLNDVGVSPL